MALQAGGTPIPEIVWYKKDKPIEISDRVGVFNEGTELRFSHLIRSDLADYTCVARNGVTNGSIHFVISLVMAGKNQITFF